MAEPISIQQLKDASEDAISLAEFINKPENTMIPRRLASNIHSLQYYLEYMKSFAQRSYETYDEMVANASNLSENVSVFVTNDSDTSKNGIYTYNGTSFVKGEYQPENAAKEFVESKLGGLEVFNGKLRAQDVSTADGSTQDVKNTEFRNKLDALPFEGGVLADTFVTMTKKALGSISRNLRDVNSDTVSVKDFGAVGDGITDDTLAIQRAIDYSAGKTLVFTSGAYLLNPMQVQVDSIFNNRAALTLVNNSNIVFDNCRIICKKQTHNSGYYFFYSENISNIRMTGLAVIAGDKLARIEDTQGEWGNLLNFKNSSDIYVGDGIILKDAFGDCITVSGCKNVDINNVSLIGGRRQNLTLAGFDNDLTNITVSNCLFIKTGDARLNVLPRAHVDIEPDGTGVQIKNIRFFNNTFTSTATVPVLGISFATMQMTTTANGVTITGNTFDNYNSAVNIQKAKNCIVANNICILPDPTGSSAAAITLNTVSDAVVQNNIVGGSKYNGVYLKSCNNVQVDGNTVTKIDLAGVMLDSSTDITVSRNTVKETGLLAGFDYKCSVKLLNSNNCELVGNTLSNANSTVFSTGSSNINLRDNTLRDFAQFGLYFTGDNTEWVVSSNNFYNMAKTSPSGKVFSKTANSGNLKMIFKDNMLKKGSGLLTSFWYIAPTESTDTYILFKDNIFSDAADLYKEGVTEVHAAAIGNVDYKGIAIDNIVKTTPVIEVEP